MPPRPILRQMWAAKPRLCMIVASAGQKSAIENKQQKKFPSPRREEGNVWLEAPQSDCGYLLLNNCLLSGCCTNTWVNFTFTAEEIAVFLPVFASG
jgi:hypothetical protein